MRIRPWTLGVHSSLQGTSTCSTPLQILHLRQGARTRCSPACFRIGHTPCARRRDLPSKVCKSQFIVNTHANEMNASDTWTRLARDLEQGVLCLCVARVQFAPAACPVLKLRARGCLILTRKHALRGALNACTLGVVEKIVLGAPLAVTVGR